MQIFKDINTQKKFDQDGFVKIDLLANDDIEELNTLFRENFPNPSADFYSSSYDSSTDFKKEISNKIGQLITPNLARVFIDYTWFGSAFLSKGNGPRSEMPMHQDWTIVDESRFVALNIWTPLQDTNDDNGTLQVIKGSHRWHRGIRAPTLPFFFDGYQYLLKSNLISVPVRATEALVLNQALIHASQTNNTDQTRVAITTGIKSKGAPMIFHYWDKNKPDVIEKYSTGDDFLIRFTNFHQDVFQRPTFGNYLGLQPFKQQRFGKAELDKFIVPAATPLAKANLLQKIIKWIKA